MEQLTGILQGLLLKAVKKALPPEKVAEAILYAKDKLTYFSKEEKFKYIVTRFVHNIALPFPVNMVILIAEDVLYHTVAQYVQEVFNDLRAKGEV